MSSAAHDARLPNTMFDLLQDRAQRGGVCLIEGEKCIDSATLFDSTRAIAAGLASLGVQNGDRVALWLPNTSAWLVSFFACAQLGAIAVSINTRFRSAEVSDLLYRSAAKVLVFWPGFKDIDFAGILSACRAASLEHLQSLVLYSEDDRPIPPTICGKPTVAYRALREESPLPANRGHPDGPCAIFTTSGTTKTPKLVLHVQQRLLAHSRNVARQYELTPYHRMLQIPPFCGVYGFCTALAAVSAGATLVLGPTWHPGRFADLIEREVITHATASNEAIAQLLEERRGVDRPFPSLQLIVSANLNPAMNDVVARCAERGILGIGLYGSSELQALLAHRRRDEDPSVRGRAGGVLASAVAKVRARGLESGGICAPGEPGELEFSAPESQFVGYFNDDAATRAALTADGYFRSGDLGSVESDGSFTFMTRLGDTLRLGGFLVSPAEIEEVIQAHPAVLSCQIVAVALQNAQRPVAFVIARENAATDEEAIIAFTAARLAKYKVPVRVFTVREFPTTPSANGSKVQKARLREMAERHLAAASAGTRAASH